MTSVITSWSSAGVQRAGHIRGGGGCSGYSCEPYFATTNHFPFIQNEDGFQTALNESFLLQMSSRKHPLINRTLSLLLISFFSQVFKKKGLISSCHMCTVLKIAENLGGILRIFRF